MVNVQISSRNQLLEIFEKHFPEQNTELDISIDLLVEIVSFFRPKRKSKVDVVNITALLEILHENDNTRQRFCNYMLYLLKNKDFDQLISDAGIINYNDFFYEVRKRLVQKILPYQAPQDTLEFILNQVFYERSDPTWLAKIPAEQISLLFDLVEFTSIYEPQTKNFVVSEVLYGLEVLTQRVAGKAMESDLSKMVPEYRNFDSPFMGLLRESTDLINNLLVSEKKYIKETDLEYKQILIFLQQCDKYIDTAFQNTSKFGISLRVNQSLLRIRHQLARIREMIPFLILDDPHHAKEKTIDFAMTLIRYNCNKSNVSSLFNESTQALAYEITQHTAQAGEHYITIGRHQYFSMFWAACGGGAIVAVLCVIKMLLANVETSDFGHALLYSMNYSLGFVTIYLTGCTLATKQPAMTASALASTLKKGLESTTDRSVHYTQFAQLFARVLRSQFIAFVGNIIMAFPAAMAIAWCIEEAFGVNIARGTWQSFIRSVNMFETPVVIHAAIAGIFLFLSGIIAGSVANRDKHHSVYYRIQEHPVLKKIFGQKKMFRIAKWYEKKWAGVISNLWFGVFMGSTASIGYFLGLNIDIRHITFASGNLALGIYGSEFAVTRELIIFGIVGVMTIGAVNFLMSFSLTLFLAFRSRKMTVADLRWVASSVWSLFKRKPWLFFFPPFNKRKKASINQ